VSGVFTNQISGATVTGTTANFTSGNITTFSGGTCTVTSGVFASGTAANPSISFVSDPNTGIYSPGADQVAISTSGTGRLFVDASGNVGLVSTPSAWGTRTAIQLNGAVNNWFAGGVNGLTLFSRNLYNDGSNKFIGASYASNYYQNTFGEHVWEYSSASGTAGAAATMLEAMRITNAGRVGIGTSSPLATLNVAGQIRIDNNTTDPNDGSSYLYQTFDIGWTIASTNVSFNTGASGSRQERLRINSSGNVGIGTSSPGHILDCLNSVNTDSAIRITNSSAGTGAIAEFVASNGTATAWFGIGGTGYSPYAQIRANGAAIYTNSAAGIGLSADNASGYITFGTGTGGGERLRITSGGFILVGKTSTDLNVAGSLINNVGSASFTRDSDIGLFVGRNTNDGTLVVFRQDGTDEGSISVSGTTVSYNGAHLSRWSQLPGGAERTEILRGTVLSNIDEMCGWGEENNEQLNRMKVSDVEGDPNVSGVFQDWDDDDDTYTDDFYCAMTGDFIIRIAEGVTVHRGDLLMSAGDGTAKPQADDIVRSKTIAKVTSVHVTCTYEDGSYCVPCVLMAC
jgi:hypothetical protein